MNIDKLKLLIQTTSNTEEWPDFLSVDFLEGQYVMTMDIVESISWFKGHFPEQAVLPGVVQTHWVGFLSEALFKLNDFTKVSNLKFKNMILPGVQASLSLKYKEEKNSVIFKFYDDNTVYTEGQMHFNTTHI